MKQEPVPVVPNPSFLNTTEYPTTPLRNGTKKNYTQSNVENNHNHNFFSPKYNRYRSDWKGDAMYIWKTRYNNG